MDQPGPSPKLVIVEDNPDLAEIYQTRLQVIGYTCFVANDGIAALYMIQKEKPDLVLLDLMVPNIAGDQILARMRASDWGKQIPVLIISNLNEADAPAGLRSMGIAGYVVKANITQDKLEQLVNGLLKPDAVHPQVTTESVAPQPVQAPAPLPTPEPAAAPVQATQPEFTPHLPPTPEPSPIPAPSNTANPLPSPDSNSPS